MKLEQIDTSTTAGKAEVMRLAVEGRTVAIRLKMSDHPWAALYERDESRWNWAINDYAIIAEPVGPEELWFTVINGNADAGPYTYEVTARDRAQNYGGTVVRYVRAD